MLTWDQYTLTYIKNAQQWNDGRPTLIIHKETDKGWEHVRTFIGDEADEKLNRLIFSEKEE